MNRYLINVTTEWCGMDQNYAAIADSEEELESIADCLAYDNFSDFDCLAQVMEDNEIDEDAAIEIEHEYYGCSIEEWDENRPEAEWEGYELVYDGRGKDAKI